MIKCILNLFSLTLATVVLSSCINEVNQRDQLAFFNSVEEVEGRIQQMNTLLKKLPSSDVSNYFFDIEGNLYINSSNIGEPDNLQLDTVSELSSLSSNEQKEFVEIALFLKKNKISGCHLEGLFDTWIYSYDQMDDNSFSNYRGIFLQIATTPMHNITQSNEILDKKGDLVLFKSKK